MSDVVIPGVDGDLTGVLLRPRAAASAPAPAVIVLPEIDGFCAGTVAAATRPSRPQTLPSLNCSAAA